MQARSVRQAMKNLAEQLAVRREQGLYRERRMLDGPQGVEITVGGEPLLSFCSNDYLGLANHPEVVAAFHAGLDEFGAGSGPKNGENLARLMSLRITPGTCSCRPSQVGAQAVFAGAGG